MKRYDFVTTFGQKEKEEGKWVKYEDIKPYIEYQSILIKNLRHQIEVQNEILREKTNPVARLQIPSN
jgi:hypothetical protein